MPKMKRGKERADLRTEELKKLLEELEIRRDQLMDEVAKKQGECGMAERIIKRTYEIILNANKEERLHEKNDSLLREEQKENESISKSRKKKIKKATNTLK